MLGDWNGDGIDEIGVFRDGVWYLDVNGDGIYNAGDATIVFGQAGDLPVVGEWDGTGHDRIGVFRNGYWYLDSNGSGAYDAGDATLVFGQAGDKPVVGDWAGVDQPRIGVYRNGTWYLDSNGSGTYDAGDATLVFGGTPGDMPVIGDWNSDGVDDIAVYSAGQFYYDSDGSGTYNAGDQTTLYGQSGDIAVAGTPPIRPYIIQNMAAGQTARIEYEARIHPAVPSGTLTTRTLISGNAGSTAFTQPAWEDKVTVGSPPPTQQAAGDYLGRYAYTGREWEAEIHLQFNRGRYYDPATGRWISQDPLGFDAGDSNLYRYVHNRPTGATDPSGLQAPTGAPSRASFLTGAYRNIPARSFVPNTSGGVQTHLNKMGWIPNASFIFGGNQPGYSSYEMEIYKRFIDDSWGTRPLSLEKQTDQIDRTFESVHFGKTKTDYRIQWEKDNIHIAQKVARILRTEWRKGEKEFLEGPQGSSALGYDSLAGKLPNVPRLESKWDKVPVIGWLRFAWHKLEDAELLNALGGLALAVDDLFFVKGAGKFALNSVRRFTWEAAEQITAARSKEIVANILERGLPRLQVLGQNACFVAGTPLLTPDGEKPIEDFRVGDRIFSRPEGDCEAPVAVKVVEETFVRTAPIWALTVGGRTIRTTAEHPFFVQGKGWINASGLQVGDLLSSHDGQWATVEAVTDLNEVATVYNLRVSDYHTYFVGAREWGFSVWAHNANYALIPHGSGYRLVQIGENGALTIVNEAGTNTPRFITAAQRQSVIEGIESAGGRLVTRAAPNLTSVPQLEGGAFQRWFNSLTGDELASVWQRGNPIRTAVERRLRNGGTMHEWLPVSQAPRFREWGITAEQIHEWTTATRGLSFRSPPAPVPRPGQGLGHGAAGSTTFHNRIFEIVETPGMDFATFRTRLQTLADEWVVGGAQALPVGLRP